MAPENMNHEEQIQDAWYTPAPNQFGDPDQDDQIRVTLSAEAGGPSRPVVVTCGEN